MNVPNIVEVRGVEVSHQLRTRPPKLPKAPRTSRSALTKANTQEVQAQRYSAGALGSMAAVITGLSLSHLAHGIEIITHPTYVWESWAMAVGIDLGMIVTEIGTLTAGERVRRETRWYAAAMIAGTLIMSAAMNAFGFASQAPTLLCQAAGVAFGIAVPAAIYVLMRQAASHYLDARRRS